MIHWLKGILGLHIRLSTGMRYFPASTNVAQVLCYRAGMLASCCISTAHFLLAGTYFTALIGVHMSGIICTWFNFALLTNRFHFEDSVHWWPVLHLVTFVHCPQWSVCPKHCVRLCMMTVKMAFLADFSNLLFFHVGLSCTAFLTDLRMSSIFLISLNI